MAITHEDVTKQIQSETRTWRINIETPRGVVPVITAHRELIKTADGELIGSSPMPAVERNVGSVISETVTLASGKVVSVADMVEAIPAFIDRWET